MGIFNQQPLRSAVSVWRMILGNRAALRAGILLALLLRTAAAAVPPGFTSKLWQSADGLPEQTVQAFAQTPDHYLWIGTTGGLLRFDGAQFTVFDQRDNTQFRENSIFALLVTKDGCLWIGTEGGGLLRYCEGRFRSYGSAQGLSDGFVRALYEDRGGTLWVGTDEGLFKLAGERLQRMDGRADMPSLAVHAITGDHLGGLWVGGSRLFRIQGESIRQFPLGGSENRVKSIAETADHTVWVGTVSGLKKLMPGASRFESVPTLHTTVRVLRQTSDGALWIGTIGQGLFRLEHDRILTPKAAATLPSNTVLNEFEDDEGNIWIGTQAGLVRWSRTPVQQIALPTPVGSDFGTIYADPAGPLWVVSTGLFQVRGDMAAKASPPGLGDVSVRNLFRDRSGALWVGTDGEGVIRLQNGRRTRLTTSEGLVNNFIRAFMQAKDGSMWFATDEGVSHLTPAGFVNYTIREGLAYFSTRALLEDRGGEIWIGTDRGVSHLKAGEFVHDAVVDTLAHDKVWSIYEDRDGAVWFGTRNDGLYRWKHDRLAHLSVQSGLASDSIYELLEDRDGAMWISGPNDVSRIDRLALNGAADDPRKRITPKIYTISDEVGPTQIYGGRQPSGCLDANGDPWFPSDRGPIHISRREAQTMWAPNLVIREVTLDGAAVDVHGVLTIPPGSKRLEIGYSPVLLRSQERVQFRYRLDGFDPEWIYASARRMAAYTNLPAGRYTFKVEAFESDHPLQIARASLEIYQKPHFYSTGWFAVGVALLVSAAAFGIHRLRLWQTATRYEAVLEERNRVAREMHDTVIQGCTSTSALLEAWSSVETGGSELGRTLLDHARTQIRTTIDEARQAVWNLRQQRPAENQLIPALERLALRVASESAVRTQCVMSGKAYSLNQCATHELLMIGREAVNNAVQHAGASRIDIRVQFSRKKIMMSVQDDGNGFDAPQPHGDNGRHYGLVGMRERTETLGGQFRVVSAPGKGTTITVEIPKKESASQVEMQDA